MKSVRGDALEAFVWNYVQDKITDCKDYEATLRLAQEAEEQSQEPKREQLAILIEQIAETEKEAADIAAALKRVLRGGAVEKNLFADMERVESLYAAQLERRKELEADLSSKKYTEERITVALRFREDVLLGLQNPTFENKRHAFEVLNVQVTIKDNQARARCLIPAEPGIFDFRTSGGGAEWAG